MSLKQWLDILTVDIHPWLSFLFFETSLSTLCFLLPVRFSICMCLNLVILWGCQRFSFKKKPNQKPVTKLENEYQSDSSSSVCSLSTSSASTDTSSTQSLPAQERGSVDTHPLVQYHCEHLYHPYERVKAHCEWCEGSQGIPVNQLKAIQHANWPEMGHPKTWSEQLAGSVRLRDESRVEMLKSLKK
jgi:hypothetical protein